MSKILLLKSLIFLVTLFLLLFLLWLGLFGKLNLLLGLGAGSTAECTKESTDSSKCIATPIQELIDTSHGLVSTESTATPNVNVATTEPPKPIKIENPVDARGQVFYGRGTANNKIGMYVHNNADDIKAAKELINSNGGDWGYVLLTMNISDNDKDSWQELLSAFGV